MMSTWFRYDRDRCGSYENWQAQRFYAFLCLLVGSMVGAFGIILAAMWYDLRLIWIILLLQFANNISQWGRPDWMK